MTNSLEINSNPATSATSFSTATFACPANPSFCLKRLYLIESPHQNQRTSLFLLTPTLFSPIFHTLLNMPGTHFYPATQALPTPSTCASKRDATVQCAVVLYYCRHITCLPCPHPELKSHNIFQCKLLHAYR